MKVTSNAIFRLRKTTFYVVVARNSIIWHIPHICQYTRIEEAL